MKADYWRTFPGQREGRSIPLEGQSFRSAGTLPLITAESIELVGNNST